MPAYFCFCIHWVLDSITLHFPFHSIPMFHNTEKWVYIKTILSCSILNAKVSFQDSFWHILKLVLTHKLWLDKNLPVILLNYYINIYVCVRTFTYILFISVTDLLMHILCASDQIWFPVGKRTTSTLYSNS